MRLTRPSTGRRLFGVSVATIAAITVAIVVTGTRISGQAPVQTSSPFEILGFMQKATIDAPADFLSGGSMTVNGHVITVPRNTILQMPALAVTWQELFAMAPPEWHNVAPVGTVSGLAQEDRNVNGQAPLATYEVHVQGNRILDPNGTNGCTQAAGCDRYIAGLIFIAQQSLNVGQGYINYIDYTKGEMRVGGIQNDPTTGARIRINDPAAKFSKGDALDASNALGTRTPDERFTIDEDNPTVRTQTGFPLCVPRQLPDDQYCPQRNRPISAPPAFDSVIGGTPFWFEPGGNSGQVVTKYDGTTYTAPLLGGIADSLLPAPFEIGDYISFSGTLVYDGAASNGGVAVTKSTAMPAGGLLNKDDTYISANTIQANLGFYTHPGSSPVYVAIDVMLMGTGGLNTATSPQEATLRTRVEGFSTDPFGAAFTGAVVGGGGKKVAGGAGSAINIYAMDVDCTGTYTDRAWITGVASDVGVIFGGAVAGRWRFRPSSGIFLPPPRNLRATMSDPRGATGLRFVTKNLPPKPGDATATPQGLETGQYNAPIFTYIFPENLVIGGATIANNFGDFPFLANGSGTYTGISGASGVIGQLAPWPLSPIPTVSCVAGSTPGTSVAANPPSVSLVSSAAIVNAGGTVTLTATATDFNLPLQTPLSVAWSTPSVGSLSAPVVTVDPNTGAVTSVVTYSAPASVSVLTTVAIKATATNAANLSTSAQTSISVEQAPTATAGAPTMKISAFIGAPLSSLAVVGTNCIAPQCSPLAAPFTVPYGAGGIQIQVQATTTNLALNPKNNISLTWTNPSSPVLSISGSQSNGAGVGFEAFNAVFKNPVTGATPGLVAGNPPQIFVFKVVATDNVTKGVATQFVTVTVTPPADVLTALVKYRTGTGGGGKGARMDVTVTSTAPIISDPNTLAVLSPQFTLTFLVTDPTDPRFGQTVVWDSWAMVLGVPTATVLGYTMPNSVTVTSSAGGSVTVSSANFTIK